MTNDTSAAYIFTRRFYELNFWHYEKEKKNHDGDGQRVVAQIQMGHSAREGSNRAAKHSCFGLLPLSFPAVFFCGS